FAYCVLFTALHFLVGVYGTPGCFKLLEGHLKVGVYVCAFSTPEHNRCLALPQKKKCVKTLSGIDPGQCSVVR
uniref:Secreted protein n=1 Tax=Parascaris univalens TaxID=6257 RepID=A0A915CA61_PARUN